MIIETTEIMICACHSLEHQVRFFYSEYDNEGDKVEELTLQVHLINKGFFRRVWFAIKYMFGYKSHWGHWDDFEFKPEDVDKLRDYLNKINNDK